MVWRKQGRPCPDGQKLAVRLRSMCAASHARYRSHERAHVHMCDTAHVRAHALTHGGLCPYHMRTFVRYRTHLYTLCTGVHCVYTKSVRDRTVRAHAHGGGVQILRTLTPCYIGTYGLAAKSNPSRLVAFSRIWAHPYGALREHADSTVRRKSGPDNGLRRPTRITG